MLVLFSICTSPVINFTAISQLPSECGIFPISETGVIVGDDKPITAVTVTSDVHNEGHTIYF